MLQSKILVSGKITRVVGNMVYVRNGDKVDVYNTDYYRIVAE